MIVFVLKCRVLFYHNVGKGPVKHESRCSYPAVYYQYTREHCEYKKLECFTFTTGPISSCVQILAYFCLRNFPFNILFYFMLFSPLLYLVIHIASITQKAVGCRNGCRNRLKLALSLAISDKTHCCFVLLIPVEQVLRKSLSLVLVLSPLNQLMVYIFYHTKISYTDNGLILTLF